MNALLAAVLSLPAAAGEDFAPLHRGWNGLSELCDLARGMGMTVEPADAIDLDDTAARTTTILIFSPRESADPAPLVRFLARGGRALIADDFFAAEPLFAALDLSRATTPAIAPEERYRDNPDLPIARPGPVGPLLEGVDAVVTNHPATLRSRLPAVLQLSSPLDAVAVAGEVGGEEPGRFVALSDPSVLINNMLEFPGNLAFARNLLSWLGHPGGRVVILSRSFALRGSHASGDRRLGPGDLYREFNAFCAGLAAVAPSRELLRALGVLLCAGLCATLLFVLRPPRRPPAGPFSHPGRR
jgi:uncharacterized protein DUF4350